jgi:hypothetical protein
VNDETPLDRAHRASLATPGDEAARLRYFGALSSTELFLLLEREAEAERIAPRVFDLDEGRFVLAFDSESRLAGFTGAATPFAALPGRVMADLLAGQGLGLAVNPGTDSAELLPAEAVAWWAATLAPAPEERVLRPEALTRPEDVPEPVLAALDSCLAGMAGLATCAWFSGLRHADGAGGLLLAFVDARDGTEAALARAVAEALRFSGLDEAAVDVAFLGSGDPLAERLARVGLRIDLAAREEAAPRMSPRPPDLPPRLR